MMVVQTRGERNRNPLNINYMKPSVAWNGQIGIELVPAGETFKARFGLYDTDFHGIRAGAKQLVKDNTAHGLKTIAALIGDPVFGWAPAADRNDVNAYASAVCGYLSSASARAAGPNDLLDLTDPNILKSIWPGFCIEENGRCLYDPALIEAACCDALGLPAISSQKVTS